MKHLRTYAGALSRPLKQFGDIITMDHCSFYDAGAQYALNGNTVALVVRGVYSTFWSCLSCFLQEHGGDYNGTPVIHWGLQSEEIFTLAMRTN